MKTTLNKISVSPSIIAFDFAELKSEITKIERAGGDSIHIDVMDGHFVPNITIGPFIVKTINRLTNLPLVVHLMIDNPEKYIDDFISSGGDTIIFHLETTKNPLKLINNIKKRGKLAGLSINPKTSENKINPYLDIIDTILIMTVNPGFCGQTFMENQIIKIEKLRKKYDGNIAIDGGINNETAKLAIKAGANILVAGNYLSMDSFTQPPSFSSVNHLKQKIKILKTPAFAGV